MISFVKTLHLNLLCFIDARLFGQKCPKNHNALTVRLKVFLFCFSLSYVCTKTEKLLSAEADLFQDNAAYPVHFHISGCETLRDGVKVGEGKKKKSRDGRIIGGLTILPRLNSLNQDPGISLGQEDILTCGQQNALITYNHRTLEYRTKGHCLRISNWQKIKSFFLFLLHFKYFFRRSPLVVFLQLCLHSKY